MSGSKDGVIGLHQLVDSELHILPKNGAVMMVQSSHAASVYVCLFLAGWRVGVVVIVAEGYGGDDE